MKLLATVASSTGRAVHSSGRPFPVAVHLELYDSDGGFRIVRIAADGAFAGDTWHLTLEEAKAQADFEYVLTPEGWHAE